MAQDGGSVTITVTRTGDPSATASVDYATSDGFGLAPCNTINNLASERCDYLTALGTLKFAPGVTSPTFVVFITDDVRVEGAEVFNLTLSNAVGGALGAQSTAMVTIADHVTAPGAANPIDTTDFFIRQLYVDLLYREPDTIGFQNWRNTLNGCPNGGFGLQNPQCDRVQVAKSFYDSQEFGERGYFIYASITRVWECGRRTCSLRAACSTLAVT